MNRYVYGIGLIIVASLMHATSVAAQPPQSCPAMIAFGNGIWTNLDEADRSLRLLRIAVNHALVARSRAPLDRGCFQLAYARNDGYSADLIEAAGQVVTETTPVLSRWLMGLQTASAAFETLIKDRLVADPFEILFGSAADDLAGHKALYRADTTVLKRRVIIVAHSQGNLFANDAYGELLSDGTIERGAIKIVPVATPSPVIVSASLPHITLFGDIILWVAAEDANTDPLGTNCMPNAVDPGAPPLPGTNGLVCHSFRTSYMSGTISESSIVNAVMASIPRITARDDTFNIGQGSTLLVAAPGVLGNDTIPDGVTATVEFLSQPNGLSASGHGDFTFTPSASFTGTVTFGYAFHTTVGDSNTATVMINVEPAPPPNVRPTAGFTMTTKAVPPSPCLQPTCATDGAVPLTVTVLPGGVAQITISAPECQAGQTPPGCSHDPDGTIASRSWTLNEVPTFPGSDPFVDVRGPGEYVWKLIVTDDDGAPSEEVSGRVIVAEASGHWSQYQHDAQHSGLSPFSGPDNPGTATPIFDLGSAGPPSAPVVGPTGLLYIAQFVDSADFQVVGVSLSGTPVLQTPTETITRFHSVSSPVVAADGTFYVAAHTNQTTVVWGFYADGQIRWRLDLDAGIGELTLGTEGTIYVAAGSYQGVENVLLALNPDGSEKWRYDYPFIPQLLWPAAVAPNGDVVAVGYLYPYGGTFIEAHDAATGQLLWRDFPFFVVGEASTFPHSPPSVGPDGTIYFVGGRYLFAWSGDGSATELWRASIGSISYTSVPAIGLSGGIRLLSGGGRLQSFGTSGVLQWQIDLATDLAGIPPGQVAMDPSGTSYVSLTGGQSCVPACSRIFAIDSGGSLLWNFPATATTSLVVDEPQTAYVVLFDGISYKLYSIQ